AIYSWPKVSFDIFVQKEGSKKISIFSSKKVREIVSDSEIQQKEVRDFIYISIDHELKKIGIDSQFGTF
ncbi:MAG: hypothetical protein IMZ56_03375, partial [Candidatus Atribacteria bacterium]|nr:hypothetical protein [Candidatus Atribacteria bacterium]